MIVLHYDLQNNQYSQIYEIIPELPVHLSPCPKNDIFEMSAIFDLNFEVTHVT